MSYRGTHIKGQPLRKDFNGVKCKTEQSHKEECDINVILKRYRKSGVLPVSNRVPQFGDATVITDFRESMEVVAKGKAEFEKLPAKIRAKYRNDPALWLEAVGDHIKKAEEEKKRKDSIPPEPQPKPVNDTK